MGFIGGLLGGKSGASFKAQKADLLSPFNQDQAAAAGQSQEDILRQQQDFVNALGGVGSQGLGAQQALLQQLLAQSQGGGPNPALLALQNATGQNIAQQASLQGSQRGVGANPALLARQLAQQGGALQQQAIGQSALQQAQQQLAAQQMLGGLSTQAVGQQQAGLSNLAGQRQATIDNILKQSAIQQQEQVVRTAAEADIARQNAAGQGGLLKDVIAGAANLGIALAAKAGKAKASGGTAAAMNKGGIVEDPDEEYLVHYLSQGALVPGKAKVEGDHPKNDTVPAMLSPGEIVVPRTAAADPKKAAAFAYAVAMRAKK